MFKMDQARWSSPISCRINFNWIEYLGRVFMQRFLSHIRVFVFIITASLYSVKVWAWDSAPQMLNQTMHWTTEKSFRSLNVKFKYKDDGSSVVRYSLTPPTEGSVSGEPFLDGIWRPLDSRLVARSRAPAVDADGYTTFTVDIGGITRVDKSELFTGTFYIWYGKQTMATINYTVFYDPFIVLSSPTGVIDLGTCHKSVKGVTLSKPVSIAATVYGYLNGANVVLTRTVNFSTLPEGASFTNSRGGVIMSGEITTLNTAIPSPPYSINDTFNARLNCDEASIGVHTWSANLVYTVQ